MTKYQTKNIPTELWHGPVKTLTGRQVAERLVLLEKIEAQAKILFSHTYFESKGEQPLSKLNEEIQDLLELGGL